MRSQAASRPRVQDGAEEEKGVGGRRRAALVLLLRHRISLHCARACAAKLGLRRSVLRRLPRLRTLSRLTGRPPSLSAAATVGGVAVPVRTSMSRGWFEVPKTEPGPRAFRSERHRPLTDNSRRRGRRSGGPGCSETPTPKTTLVEDGEAALEERWAIVLQVSRVSNRV